VKNDPFYPQWGRPITPWFKSFAWVPVWTVDRGWVWLVRVNCRRIHKLYYLEGGPDFWFQYARGPVW
jgi:hypothetical protein